MLMPIGLTIILRAFGPTQYDLTSITVCPQLSTAPPFFNSIKLETRWYDYLPNGPIDNIERSNLQLRASTRFGYEFDQGWTAFVEPSYEVHAFTRRVDSQGLNHDSQTYQALAGITYDATADLYAELGIGYFYQPFYSIKQKTQGGLALNGSLVWNFADNATLSATLSQSNQDVQPFDVTLRTSTLVETTALVRLDYAATDQLFAFASGALTNDAYGGAPLAEARAHRARQNGLSQRHSDTRRGEREPDHPGSPVEPCGHEERPRARIDIVADEIEESHERQAHERGKMSQRQRGTERVRAAPGERPAAFLWQGFRQHERAEAEIGQGKRRCAEKVRARTELAERTADSRPENEAKAEGRAHESERPGALLRRRDVGDERVRRHEYRSGHACDGYAEEAPSNVGRKSEQGVVEPERKQRREDHRAPSEVIAEVPDDRTADELKERVGSKQIAGDARRRSNV
jgi:hypothetical protein